MKRTATFAAIAAVAAISIPATFIPATVARGEDFDGDPINYGTAPAADAVSRLVRRVESGEVRLEKCGEQGYLRSLLRELEVPVSSQVLVFSRTSFQRSKISPHRPRALYFNDRTYVGYVQGGEVLELASVDPTLGTIFHVLEQGHVEQGSADSATTPPATEKAGAPAKSKSPRFLRLDAECLQCHASALTQGVPGLFVRSVYPDDDGQPILRAGTFNIDHRSPIKTRWGGWYVTGSAGLDGHLGNCILNGENIDPEKLGASPSPALRDLSGKIEVERYLSPHSDIVSLLILEHQSQVENLITRASYQTRIALRDQRVMAEMLKEPDVGLTDSTRRRIEHASKPLLKYLFLVDEAPLRGPIEGTSYFQKDFQARGPKDRQGRSLRDLDLHSRLFRYPLSYLVHSEAFDALPAQFLDHLLKRMHEILTGEDRSEDFAHLSEGDRRAILEILRETKPGLPDFFREKAPEAAPSSPATPRHRSSEL